MRGRFAIELTHRAGDRVEGTVTPEGAAPIAFSGWLELLRLLEAPAAAGTPEAASAGDDQATRTGVEE